MKIYSFEFGNKPVKYEVNKFKDKEFLGTQSRNFYPSKSLVLLPHNYNFVESIKLGSFYAPIAKTDSNVYVSINKFSFNLDLINGIDEDSDDNLIILLLDTQYYRILDYALHSEYFNEGLNICTEICKTWRGKTVEVAAVTARSNMKETFIIILVLYNKLLKKYQYYEIRKTETGIVCADKSKDNKSTLDKWAEEDKRRKYAGIHFNEFIQSPRGKFYVAFEKDYDELSNILEQWFISKPIIVKNDDLTSQQTINLIKETFHGSKLALTWYKQKPVINTNQNIEYPIELNFTMDETGVLRGYRINP